MVNGGGPEGLNLSGVDTILKTPWCDGKRKEPRYPFLSEGINV